MTDSRLFADILTAIRKAERILVVSDGGPDGDSVGSSTAMWNWLRTQGKKPVLFCPNPVPRTFKFVDGFDAFSHDPEILNQSFDLVLVFDASDMRHGGNEVVIERVPKPYTLICFDHHNTNPRFGDLNAVFTDACSTCEVTYRFFEENKIPIDDKMATSLLTGLCTDTSNFSNAATNARGLEAAAACAAAGARHADILRHIVRNKTVPGLKLWGLALQRLHEKPEYDMAITYFLQSDLEGLPGAKEAVEGVSNFLNATCAGIDTILVLRELPDGTVKGSMRSQNRDISKLAKALGGGGHKKAAGFVLQGKLEVHDGMPHIV